MRSPVLLAAPLALFVSIPAAAQGAIAEKPAAPAVEAAADEAPDEPAGPPYTTEADWLEWERLGGATLSPDGRWVTYSISKNDGTSTLYLRVVAGGDAQEFEQGRSGSFSDDGRWFMCLLGHSEAEREKLRDKKQPAENTLALFDLLRGERVEVERVASATFSADGGHVAMRRYAPKGGGAADLVVRALGTGSDTHFGSVDSYAWSDVGAHLAMTISAEDDAGNGVRVFDAGSGALRTLDSAATSYVGLGWREDAFDLAVMRERVFEEEDDDEEEKPKKPRKGDEPDATYEILAWRGLDGDSPRATAYDLVADEAAALGDSMRVVTFAGLRWSDDGNALYFGLKPWDTKPAALAGEAEEKEAEGPEGLRASLDDAPGVEVWHPKDVQVVPRQKVTERSLSRENDLVALHLDGGADGGARLVRLEQQFGDAGPVESVSLLEGGRWAVGFDETPHLEEQRFSATQRDVYSVDVATGERTKRLERIKYVLPGDPRGERVLYVLDDHIWVLDLTTGSTRNLTAACDARFIDDFRNTLTDQHGPYGVAGWTEDGSTVVLNSRYDLWAFGLDGSAPERLTNGGADRIQHRVTRVAPDPDDERWLDLDAGLLVSLYGDTTKRSGYGRVRRGAPLERLAWADARLSRLARSESGEVWLHVRERYDDSPDLFVTDASLAGGRTLTTTNAHAADVPWGRAELVDYTNANGRELQGALYYPAGYVEGETYPMIVYIYEMRSQGLHGYTNPSERSPYNTSVFTQNGYFVYQPDIVYRDQNPGLSAVECVVPAVEKVLESGMVDKERVGLVGHSWGAYQTAFIVTQTDLFAAGVAGAPLTNMISMSVSNYWNSGQTNTWIFHESQGRMDKPFWQDVDTYIANSPIFSIDQLNTPLLVAFGDDDGAVDWQQGIEMYNAARLVQKPLVMLVYPGENHGLAKKPNQVDYHHRVRAWFDHFLKDAEAKPWITDGVPWLEQKKALEELSKD